MKHLFQLFFVFFSVQSFCQVTESKPAPKTVWVDSVYNKLNFDEKVGQLFMIAAYSNRKEDHAKELDKLIEQYKIGGLIFFQGGPARQAKLTNRFQSKSKIPMLIGNDAEWGLSMRLDSTVRYPWNMTLGAIQDNKILEKMGSQMAKQCKRMGIHFTFGPVVDINTNPNNPIIGNRSFGETKENVTEKALAYMKGLQGDGVFATAKHFPGHGDTASDSHYSLPTITFDKNRINEVELYPYKELIKNGLGSIMVAHLNVPSLEPREGRPSSISYPIVNNLLKNELKFEGLIFTDALNMKGASNFKQPGEIDLEAFLAGNDVLLFAEDVPKAVEKFREAFKNKLITEERLAYSVKKILDFKYQANLHKYQPIVLENLYQDLNLPEYDALNFEMYENATTVLKNQDNIIPIVKLEKEKIAYVKIGDGNADVFISKLKDFATVTEIKSNNLDQVLAEIKNYTKVIVGYHKPDGTWKKNDMTFKEINWIDKISKKSKTILVYLNKPYSLLKIPNFNYTEGVILSYQNHEFSQTIAAEIIFGSKVSKGKIPVNINKNFKVGDGILTTKTNRLGYNLPENVGLSSIKLARIEEITNKAISKKAAPGMQILIARKGQIVYHKSFGNHTFGSDIKVQNTDIYDVASLTKILSTLPNIMQQYDKGNLKLDTTLDEMLPQAANTNKAKATLLDMLTHQAKFQAWIPFYKNTLDAFKKPSAQFYRNSFNPDFPLKVMPNLYLIKNYNDTILKDIFKTDLLTYKQYKYSDFTFILLKEYLELKTKQKLNDLSENNFYNIIGAKNTLYNPLTRFEKSKIVPSEIDDYFRYQILQGNVHDMAAAMQGGVSGHAGLFSTATDIAKMMQMYLQKGNYGNHQFFSEKTFNDFNTCYFCKEGTKRGLGFDKRTTGSDSPTCGCVSKESFGHTGYTGTMTWADPEKELIYVFLSNRTFPSAATNRLAQQNVRENIQQAIYDSIIF